MVTVLGEDYITFAQAKGLPDREIFLRYGIRNALLPQVTGLAISFGLILGSGVLIESIFTYPGIGSLIYGAINTKDYFVINGTVAIMVLCAASALLIVDILYPFIDPRFAIQIDQYEHYEGMTRWTRMSDTDSPCHPVTLSSCHGDKTAQYKV